MPQAARQSQANSPQSDVSQSERAGLHLSFPHSGIIILSSSARILHMNEPARALMALLGTSHELWPQMAPDSMPSILTEFCYDVQVQLQRRIEAQEWAHYEIRRVCHMTTPSLLLTGFAVPHSTNREVRIILTLNPLPFTPSIAENAGYLDPTTHRQASAMGARS
jgi:hypothetical protein